MMLLEEQIRECLLASEDGLTSEEICLRVTGMDKSNGLWWDRKSRINTTLQRLKRMGKIVIVDKIPKGKSTINVWRWAK